MGRKDDAIREGRRAVELKPESKDAVDGVIVNCYLALIYARVGEKDLAFPLLERFVKTPGAVDSVDYSITINDLKHRWEWGPDPKRSALSKTARTTSEVTFPMLGHFNRTPNLSIANRGQNMRLDLSIEQ
jgi:hypothetical protein